MELWIRSQNREDLVKVNALWIMDNQIWMEVPFYDNHKKLGLTVTNNNHRLAVYKTKERAIEVLDEIQKILKPKGIIKFDGILNAEAQRQVSKMLDDKYLIFNNNVELLQQVDTFVYEMPKE